jgi:neutral ceramidase
MNKLLCNYNKVDITPKTSVYLAGFANREKKSNSVHKALLSQCLVLNTSSSSVCIVSNDFTEIAPKTVNFIKKEVNKTTGLNEQNIYIHSIHTHAAPIMSDMLMKTEDLTENEKYKKWVVNRIIKNCIKTITETEKYKSCKIKIGEGGSSLGICRRSIDPETGKAVIGRNIAVEREQKLIVLQLEDEVRNKPYVTLFNYACHPVCLHETNLAVSPDYIRILLIKI